MKTLHLLLATVEDPHDPAAWSGTPHALLKALQAEFGRVTVLHSAKPQRSLAAIVPRLLLGRHRYPLWMSRAALKHYARRLEHAVAENKPDAVLCISSQHLVYARSLGLPVFMLSDAPWMAYKQAYRDYDPMPLPARRYAAQEAAAAQRISGVIYPTPWACAQAQTLFGLPPERVDRIALGANRFCQDSDETVLQRIRQRAPAPLQLLFVGKDWERKGGPLAVEVVRELNRKGCPARLTIVGCTPALQAEDAAYTEVLGFLSAKNPADQQRMQTAFAQAHFFLLPSRAECFGLVFAEAQSYGLPCIALDCQGIPGVVDQGVTGLLFAPGTEAAPIASDILKLAADGVAYEAMAVAARRKFRQELCWEAFGQRLHQRVAVACAAAA